jgi:YidC/Oxa1 family membrane protein insertase
MEIQRVILLFALAFIALLIYQRWVEEQTPDKPPATAQTQSPGQEQASVAPPAADIPATPKADLPPVQKAAGSQSEESTQAGGQIITVETDLLRAEISLLGGSIKRLSLLQYPVSIDEPGVPFDLLKMETADIFITQTGLIGNREEYPNHRSLYQAKAEAFKLQPGDQELVVPLYWEGTDGVRYTKNLVFTRDSYNVRIEFVVDNQSVDEWSGYVYAQFLRTQVVQSRGFFLDVVPAYLGGAIYTPEDKFDKVDFSDMVDADLNKKVDSGWVAMLQHYFVGAWFPQGDGPFQFYSRVINEVGGPRYNIGFNTLRTEIVPAGATGKLAVELFAGPKEQNRLKQQAEGFGLTVDFGWLTPVSVPLFWVLDKIHGVVQNWGWSIILLTMMIKLAFYPLSATSYKSMAKMKKLQPRLKTLKERHGDDKAKLNQAMMAIYKKEKVNPLGGCLPIVIQIPVFIALYWVLLESVELRQAPFVLWIKDLSLKDPFFVLPLLMGASMLGQQFLNPSPMDPMQKKIMMAMPVVFTFMFLYFPAGLVLYWLVNNVLSIAQQWYVNKVVIGHA